MPSSTPDPTVGNRVATQRFVRHLLQNPDKANEFLVSAQEVAAKFGVTLSDRDVQSIQEGLLRISRRRGSAGETPTTPMQPGTAPARPKPAPKWAKKVWVAK